MTAKLLVNIAKTEIQILPLQHTREHGANVMMS